jgi:hypothetical protein
MTQSFEIEFPYGFDFHQVFYRRKDALTDEDLPALGGIA